MCPRCGGTARKQISDYYYECTSRTVLSLIGPHGPVEGVCRNRYHEGGHNLQLGLCWCGTVAIRLCGRCRCPMCGDHSVWFESFDTRSWHCPPCRDAINQERDRQLESWRVSAEEHYQHLPPVGEDVLAPWLCAELPESAFEDGVTHQALDWSGRDVADLLARIGPGFSQRGLLITSKLSTERLTRDGSVWGSERNPMDTGDHYGTPSSFAVQRMKPDEPFTEFRNGWGERTAFSNLRAQLPSFAAQVVEDRRQEAVLAEIQRKNSPNYMSAADWLVTVLIWGGLIGLGIAVYYLFF